MISIEAVLSVIFILILYLGAGCVVLRGVDPGRNLGTLERITVVYLWPIVLLMYTVVLGLRRYDKWD